ncbi:hypothetical protein BCV72DRAFT_288035 [Rhizopus microsporus var. microsporus]|uniref:BHLH domain-containing protein n=2 Tax=Rhizopus microsporus TaxID=58291 RepID=A0A2G4T5T7_RHIZD|nr:uncharacterized protein RHIMIDRAFT_265820 [Rhizopus microsporus ATCC 52813]ORE09003.1 hypothetical protein BCV72DRAFT_288035 [Rhizopus microsporus var. microsporus]PHZ16367.1 hypothetical protein RHIMIDRAFT_265820 [Rhizopus microsporus ATCC 52813]
MMLQELSDLDFDAYFEVANSNQQNNNRDILYHEDQQQNRQQQSRQEDQNESNSSMLPSISSPTNNNNNRYYSSPLQHNTQQQQSNFLFNWGLQQQQQQQRQTHISPSSSPLSSSDGYTSHSLSPPMSSPPLYSINAIKDEANKALAGFFSNNKKCLYTLNHDVPGINIPTTPMNDISPQQAMSTTHTELPSPPLDVPVANFSSMNQWCQFKSPVHPLDEDEDDKDDKHWRKTTRQATIRTISDPNLIHAPGKQLKKVAHNAIERRYRNNINDRIRELKNVVPALYKARVSSGSAHHHDKDDDNSSTDSETEIVDGVEVAKKLNKATILRKATEYIQFLKTSNERVDKENLILQQIIAQMPGGQEVLSRFLYQKSEFEKAENERLARERREAQERERIERQKLLRERAAQRAALAQLLPKPERRPYRRRQSKKTSSKKSSSSEDETSPNNKVFMAAFMCLAFFTAAPSSSPIPHEPQGGFTDFGNTSTSSTYYRTLYNATFLDIWPIARYAIYTFGLFYLLLLPLALRWLRPRPVKRPKKCLDHCHYASEVPTAWSRLYINLVQLVGKSSPTIILKHRNDLHSILLTLVDITRDLVYLLVPQFMLQFLHRNSKPSGCPEELSRIGAWIRLNEVECLGGNPDISRLSMLHSSLGMLAQLHKMKRDKDYVTYCGHNTIARVHASIALQLELCLPPWIASHVVPAQWQKVIDCLNSKNEDEVITHQFLTSECHTQILHMLNARNGFNHGAYLFPEDPTQSGSDNCRNVFYSFVLPYVTSPLDLVLYWQQLARLENCWFDYLDGVRPVFSEKQLNQVLSVSATTTAPGHMLQWWVRVGLALESLTKAQQENMDILAEYTRAKGAAINSHPSSNLLRRHQSMICHLLEAACALVQNTRLERVPMLLEQASKDHFASSECIRQIASTDSMPSSNYEASVLVLSTLAVHLRTLKALIIHQSLTSRRQSISAPPSFSASQASTYIAQLRDQVLQDLDSPYAKSLAGKCRKHIQSYIYQADDTLSL